MVVVLIAIALIAATMQSFFLKLFSAKYKNTDDSMASTVFNLTYGTFAAAATFVLMGFRFSASRLTLLCGLANAVVLLVYNFSMMRASQTGSYALQMVFMLFGGIVVPMLHSVLFLGDPITVLQCVAVAMMLTSFLLMNWNGLSLKGSKGGFMVWCVLLFVTNGLYGVLLNFQQRSMAGAQRNEMIVLSYFGMSALCFLTQGLRQPKKTFGAFRMSWSAAICLLGSSACAATLAHLTMYILTMVSSTALYTILNGGVLLISVVLSAVIFKEKTNRLQKIGFALALASIIMLSF